MAKKSERPQSRRHLWMYDEDWKYLETRFGGQTSPGPLIREMIHRYVKGLRAQQLDALDGPGASPEVAGF